MSAIKRPTCTTMRDESPAGQDRGRQSVIAPHRMRQTPINGVESLARSYVLFLCWSVSALVTELRIEDLSGYRHRKTAFSTEFSQLRSAATESYSNFGLALNGVLSSSLPEHRRRICVVVARPSGRRCAGAMPWLSVRVAGRRGRLVRRAGPGPRLSRSAGISPGPAAGGPQPAWRGRRPGRSGPGRPVRAPRPRSWRWRGPGPGPAGGTPEPARGHR